VCIYDYATFKWGFFVLVLCSWFNIIFADVMLSFIGSSYVNDLSLARDPFQGISKDDYCYDWEQDLYMYVSGFCGIICMVVVARWRYMVLAKEHFQDDDTACTDEAIQAATYSRFHAPALMAIWLPTSTVFFIALCFLGACRGTRTTQLSAWVISLTVVYCLLLVILCFIVHCVNSFGESFSDFWNEKDLQICQKIGSSKGTDAAIKDARQVVAALLGAGDEKTFAIELRILPEEETRQVQVSKNFTAVHLYLAMQLTEAKEVTFKLGDTKISGTDTLGSHGVEPDAVIVATCSGSELSADMVPSPVLDDSNIPNGPQPEFQANFKIAYENAYNTAYSREYTKALLNSQSPVTLDIEVKVNSQSPVTLDMEDASELERTATGSPTDVHASSAMWRLVRFNPVDEALLANIVIYLIICWGSYIAYTTERTGTV